VPRRDEPGGPDIRRLAEENGQRASEIKTFISTERQPFGM
jgi:hypothetical protein